MKRRRFLEGFGVVAMGLADGSTRAMAATAALIDDPATFDITGIRGGAKCCRVIGVGGAGCALLAAMRNNGTFDCYGPQTELIAVDLCPDTLLHVAGTNKAMPERDPIKTLAIAECGSGGRVNAERASALRHHDQLKGLLTGADVVMLIAGLGGGTGSGVTPILAAWSRAAGALTVVVTITPFDFCRSIRQSNNALKSLRRNADQVIHFSNQALAGELGDDATLSNVFAIQEHRISSWLQDHAWNKPEVQA
jgi:cell division protein FtsZ